MSKHSLIDNLPKEYKKIYRELKKGKTLLLEVSRPQYRNKDLQYLFGRYRIISSKTCEWVPVTANYFERSCFTYDLSVKIYWKGSFLEKMIYAMYRFDQYDSGDYLKITDMISL